MWTRNECWWRDPAGCHMGRKPLNISAWRWANQQRRLFVMNISTLFVCFQVMKTYHMYHSESISAESKLKEAEKQEEKQIGRGEQVFSIRMEDKYQRRSSVKKIEKMKEKVRPSHLESSSDNCVEIWLIHLLFHQGFSFGSLEHNKITDWLKKKKNPPRLAQRCPADPSTAKHTERIVAAKEQALFSQNRPALCWNPVTNNPMVFWTPPFLGWLLGSVKNMNDRSVCQSRRPSVNGWSLCSSLVLLW